MLWDDDHDPDHGITTASDNGKCAAAEDMLDRRVHVEASEPSPNVDKADYATMDALSNLGGHETNTAVDTDDASVSCT